jgi:hypothetical protein
MRLVDSIGAKAAPWPVFGTFNQSGFDRVAVHVAELLDSIGFGEDIEVVVARFPNKFIYAGSGEALLEDLNRSGELLPVGLGYKKMDVVRHEDVAEDVEEVFPAGLFKDSLEGVTGFRGFEDVGVAVATDGNEVEVAGVLAAVEAFWHGMSLRRN